MHTAVPKSPQTARRPRRGAPPPARPPLTAHTSLDDFRSFYWYLAELADFCRAHGLEAAGHKHEVVSRVERFLSNGRGDTLAVPPRPSRGVAPSRPAGPITPDTPVTAAYRCNTETRDFFKSVVGPRFHFTARMQQFRRQRQSAGIPLTYGDLAREWLREAERRKDPNYRATIHGAWQYNQFVRDFMGDKTRNAGKGIGAAAKAWNRIRVHRGPHTYAEYRSLQENE